MWFFFKFFARIFRYTIYAALAFVIGAIVVLTLTERGRDNLAGLISDFASSPGQVVKISGINGIWSGNLTLQSFDVGRLLIEHRLTRVHVGHRHRGFGVELRRFARDHRGRLDRGELLRLGLTLRKEPLIAELS